MNFPHSALLAVALPASIDANWTREFWDGGDGKLHAPWSYDRWRRYDPESRRNDRIRYSDWASHRTDFIAFGCSSRRSSLGDRKAGRQFSRPQLSGNEWLPGARGVKAALLRRHRTPTAREGVGKSALSARGNREHKWMSAMDFFWIWKGWPMQVESR